MINHWNKLQREVVDSPLLSFLMTSFFFSKRTNANIFHQLFALDDLNQVQIWHDMNSPTGPAIAMMNFQLCCGKIVLFLNLAMDK